MNPVDIYLNYLWQDAPKLEAFRRELLEGEARATLQHWGLTEEDLPSPTKTGPLEP